MDADSTDLTNMSLDTLKWNNSLHSTVEHSWRTHPTPAEHNRTSPDSLKQEIFDSPRANVIGAEPAVERHEESHGIRPMKTNAADTVPFSTLLDPLVPDVDSGNQPSHPDGSAGYAAKYQHSSESLFCPLSRSLTNNLDKQSGHLYRRPLNEKHLSAAASITLSSMWDQQPNPWSKSTSQQLRGLDCLSSLNHSLPPFFNPGLSEPNKTNNLSDHSISTLGPLDTNGCFSSNNPLATHPSVIDEERRLHCPDGADQPDEHLWLYEDPQGRTQGSFSDAQMNDWLSTGIYFTPVLRIRRKCDTTFSTLADYTRLFGRTPFTPGPRVPPIRGGVTPSMINASNKSATLLQLQLETASDSTRLLGSSPQTNCGSQSSGTSRVTSTSDFPTSGLRFSNHLTGGEENALGLLKTTSNAGYTNSSLPVLPGSHQSAQFTTMSNSLSTLNMPNQSSNTPDNNQSVTSASTFMALASLISVNPALASLAMSYSGQSPESNHADFATTTLAPAFLAALAQYLNVQPQLSGHQPASPMQQLAETAQLAAQLAALAGSNSPIEPAQALALAELIRSQAQATSGSQWLSHAKKETASGPVGTSGAVHQDTNVDSSGTKCRFDDSSVGRDGGPVEDTLGDDNQLDLQSHWPSLPSSTGSGVRGSGRTGDSRRPVNAQSNAHAQPIGSRNGASKAALNEPGPTGASRAPGYQHSWFGAPASSCGDTPANSGGRSGQSANEGGASKAISTSNQQGTADVQWVNKVKQKAAHSSIQATRTGSDGGTNTSNHVTTNTSSTVGKSLRPNTTQSKAGTDQEKIRTKTTATQRSPLKVPNSSQLVESKASASAPVASATAPCVLTESGRTAEEELAQLTQWCQARLSQMPMREKVDIPTVVELLATLDAPYEVETMVQTFLGESSRTSLFVKDFLDQRRPFWQLHRERRDCEALMNANGKSSNSTSNGSATRSTDKKKRSGVTHESVGSQANPNNGTAGWIKVKSAQTTVVVDQSQDNQWHHIKPKGTHNRKGKKDKSSRQL